MLFVIAALALAAYFALPCIYVRSMLDGRMLLPAPQADTIHDRLYEVPCEDGRSVIIRRYGKAESGRVVVFFPGRAGGVARYEPMLLLDMVRAGFTVYALSYPGQDGAKGPGSLAALRQDVARALDTLDAVAPGQVRQSVFVGRSLGATVAVFEAARVRPRALLLDGVSPSLPDMLRAHFRRHWYMAPWSLLPLERLVEDRFDLKAPLTGLEGTPVTIFQGDDDDVTPLADIERLRQALPWISLTVVPRGTHSDSILIARKDYFDALNRTDKSWPK